MTAQGSPERQFSDSELLSMAVACLKHARQSTAIRDCRCAACCGFMEQSGELLEVIDRQKAQAVKVTQSVCTHTLPCKCGDCPACDGRIP